MNQRLVLFLSLFVTAVVGVGPLVNAPLSAQDVRVKVGMQEPPYYAGESAVIQFTVDGFEEDAEPTCVIDSPTGELPSGMQGEVSTSNPSVVSQVIQRNGQFFQSRRVTYQINYLVTAEQPGEFKVGPFLIKQGKL